MPKLCPRHEYCRFDYVIAICHTKRLLPQTHVFGGRCGKLLAQPEESQTMKEPLAPTEATTDDRFFSLRFLSYELEQIAEQGEQAGERNDGPQMRAALERARHWRAQLDQWLEETGRALGDVAALDSLLDSDQTEGTT